MRARAIAAFAVVLAMLAAGSPAAVGAAEDPAKVGRFTKTFVEPTIGDTKTDEKCIPAKGKPRGNEQDTLDCKPAAGAMALLPNHNVVYWNALEGSENIKNGIALEFGRAAVNDQTRVLDLNLRAPSSRSGARLRPTTAERRTRAASTSCPSSWSTTPSTTTGQCSAPTWCSWPTAGC